MADRLTEIESRGANAYFDDLAWLAAEVERLRANALWLKDVADKRGEECDALRSDRSVLRDEQERLLKACDTLRADLGREQTAHFETSADFNAKATEVERLHTLHREVIRILNVWIDENECGCEADHICGKPHVLRVIAELEQGT